MAKKKPIELGSDVSSWTSKCNAAQNELTMVLVQPNILITILEDWEEVRTNYAKLRELVK